MDTYAAVQRLQAHGLTREQAEDILAVLQEGLARENGEWRMENGE